ARGGGDDKRSRGKQPHSPQTRAGRWQQPPAPLAVSASLPFIPSASHSCGGGATAQCPGEPRPPARQELGGSAQVRSGGSRPLPSARAAASPLPLPRGSGTGALASAPRPRRGAGAGPGPGPALRRGGLARPRAAPEASDKISLRERASS
ncbi:hypothetical protein KIL84_011881, partial [Mauremys mutica]